MGRRETGDRKQETGDRRRETGERRRGRVLKRLSKKFRAYNLAAELNFFVRTLIANRNYKLVVVEKFAKWG